MRGGGDKFAKQSAKEIREIDALDALNLCGRIKSARRQGEIIYCLGSSSSKRLTHPE